MTAVQRQDLKSLQLGSQNSIVIGVIISSLNPKTFEAQNQKFGNGGMRSVWTFTLRDSEEDFINVTVWGGVEYINRLFHMHRIGSVVEVISGKVGRRQMQDRNEMFVPTVSSPFNLTVNEGIALIQAHDSPAYSRYEALLRIPAKNANTQRLLSDIFDNIIALKETFVDILAVVTFVGQAQDIMTRDGRHMSCRVFEASDGSTDEVVSLRLWEDEWIRISELWVPRKTVLFIADARIGFDNYKKKYTITIVRKTVITENPDIPQATVVRNTLRNKPETLPSDPFALPNPKNITTVMTIQEITEKLNMITPNNGERLQFLTIIYAHITEMNLDSDGPGFLVTKCALCKRSVKTGNDSCMNLECPCGNGAKVPINVVTMNLKVHLKDDTGYLVGCRLYGVAAESAIGYSAADIQAMSLKDRVDLKWKFNLAKCDVRLQVFGPTIEYPRAIYNILSLKRIEDVEDVDFLDLLND